MEYFGGCIHGGNPTKFGRIRSDPRLRVASNAPGEARWAVDRRCDVGGLGCVGRLALTSPLRKASRIRGQLRGGKSTALETILRMNELLNDLVSKEVGANDGRFLKGVIGSKPS
jgi:hypothetical protein